MRNVFGQVWHMKVEGGLGEVFRSFTEVKGEKLHYSGPQFNLRIEILAVKCIFQTLLLTFLEEQYIK